MKRKTIQIILLNFILFYFNFIYCKCPNLCSGHGRCGGINQCICDEGWNGGNADCSASKFKFKY